MDIDERILLIIEKERLNVSSFAKMIGVGDQTIRGIVIQKRNKPSFDIIYKIIQTFAWINPYWFITGEGNMKKECATHPVKPKNDTLDTLVDYLREKDDKIERLIEEKTEWRVKYESLYNTQSC